jgi:hypothetical protein
MRFSRRSHLPKDEKRAFWNAEWGSGYAPDFKYAQLAPLLDAVERAGKLGTKMLDIGSGSMSPRNNPDVTLPLFYPTEGKLVVRADLGMPYPHRTRGGILEIRADIEDLHMRSPRNLMNLVRVCRHIGADPRRELPVFDTLLMSDILNYVDFRKTLPGLLPFLRDGGRLVVCNWPDMGLPEAFSPGRPQSNGELLRFIGSAGLETEHLHHGGMLYPGEAESAWYSQPSYPFVEQSVSERCNMMLVAVKKG